MGGTAGKAADVHGLVPGRTSFVGRSAEVTEVAELLDDYRLVTVTGPGGVGKTRLAGEVARRVAGRFADGVWLVEMASVQDPALIPAVVAGILGIRQVPTQTVTESLVGVLSRQQLLLVLDNCEHVLARVAKLCESLLAGADDIRVLATSREPTGVGGEVRYRLPPLPVSSRRGEDGPAAAVALFADRARMADPHFRVTSETAPAVAGLVARLDGIPLAIELAAARIESLGLAQLLDRLDQRLSLLASGSRTAVARHQSLAATVDWSYQLLSQLEQQAFRRLAVFPGPFTLDAAMTVAGPAAEAITLHLVDCSMLAPPRVSPDGRTRYLMLETLRAFGLERLAEAGEQSDAAVRLARHALQVTEQAASALQAGAEEWAAARYLDAEQATVHQALTWALQHDRPTAARLAIGLAPWWYLRGRAADGYEFVSAAARQAVKGSQSWCTAQFWLGLLASNAGGVAGGFGHFTAIRDAISERGPSTELADAMAGRSITLLNLGRIPEAEADARQSLAMAKETGHLVGEVRALRALCLTALYTGDARKALEAAQRADQVSAASIPGRIARMRSMDMTMLLIDVGDLAAAQTRADEGLALARQADDLPAEATFLSLLGQLAWRSGQLADAEIRLREALTLARRMGDWPVVMDCLDSYGYLYSKSGQWPEAVTLWSALASFTDTSSFAPHQTRERQQSLITAAQVLGEARVQEARERGAAMTLETASEFALMTTEPDSRMPRASDGLPRSIELSDRERELVALIAQGRTDAQIAKQLYISVSTVRSHLDRIRDKTSCRRRADLTRLALQAGLA